MSSRRSRAPSASTCRRTARSTASTSSPFFEGRQKTSNRESFLYFAPNGQVRAVKWRDWKLHYVWQDEPGQPVERTMKLFNLRSDPKEETDIKDANPWVPSAIGKLVDDFWATVDKYPLIPVGTPDPYQPPAGTHGARAAGHRRDRDHVIAA